MDLEQAMFGVIAALKGSAESNVAMTQEMQILKKEIIRLSAVVEEMNKPFWKKIKEKFVRNEGNF